MRKTVFIVFMLMIPLALFARGSAEDDGVTTITWWHSNSGIIQEAADALVEKFNETTGAENGIRVEAVYQGSANDTLTKVKTVMQAGDLSQLPDLVQLDATGVTDMSTYDNVYFIDELAANQGEDLSFMLDHALESMRYKGKIIALPFNASTILFYYNKTAFEEAGFDAPQTIDELTEMAKVLTQRDKDGKVTRYTIASVPTTYELCAFIGMQHGLSYITDMKKAH